MKKVENVDDFSCSSSRYHSVGIILGFDMAPLYVSVLCTKIAFEAAVVSQYFLSWNRIWEKIGSL